jgi:hypothetical protein
MTLEYLKEITNNFCDEGILGRGGFGVVYKVMLNSFLFLIYSGNHTWQKPINEDFKQGVLANGKIIAVKKLAQSVSSSQE